jgi:hypothetical protein
MKKKTKGYACGYTYTGTAGRQRGLRWLSRLGGHMDRLVTYRTYRKIRILDLHRRNVYVKSKRLDCLRHEVKIVLLRSSTLK